LDLELDEHEYRCSISSLRSTRVSLDSLPEDIKSVINNNMNVYFSKMTSVYSELEQMLENLNNDKNCSEADVENINSGINYLNAGIGKL